ncbi:replicative helicase loader/inhibitor [Geobacillus sp. CCR]
MTRDEVKQIFKIIAYVYPNFEVSSEKVDVWHELLADEPFENALHNVKRHVKQKPFPPTIADLCYKEIKPPYFEEYVHDPNAGEDW